MPLHCSLLLSPLDQEAFHAVDKRVMKSDFTQKKDL